APTVFFSPAPAPPATSTLSLHDALPISCGALGSCAPASSPPWMTPSTQRSRIADRRSRDCRSGGLRVLCGEESGTDVIDSRRARSEEHTSELQSRENLVCRLLLEKKKKK